MSNEEHHVYELVTTLDNGRFIHLRCPKCGKEVSREVVPPGTKNAKGYKVLRNEKGELLQGDFSARHTYSSNVNVFDITVKKE